MLRVASTVRDKLEGPVLIISRKHLAAKINPGKTTSLVEINQHFQRQGIYFFFTQNRCIAIGCSHMCHKYTLLLSTLVILAL